MAFLEPATVNLHGGHQEDLEAEQLDLFKRGLYERLGQVPGLRFAFFQMLIISCSAAPLIPNHQLTRARHCVTYLPLQLQHSLSTTTTWTWNPAGECLQRRQLTTPRVLAVMTHDRLLPFLVMLGPARAQGTRIPPALHHLTSTQYLLDRGWPLETT